MPNARSLMLSIVMSVLFCLTLSSGTASAQVSCGGAGERACCLTERIPSCNSGLVEVSGCTTGSCQCQDGVSLFFGTKSSGTCVGPTSCGGQDERACCITETRYDSNPIPFSGGCKYNSTYSGLAGLTEVAGVPSGVSALCGGSNPFQIQSNGMCRTCGTEGVRACKVNGVDTCQAVVGGMLSPDGLGICRSCGAQGQPTCALGMCAPGLHPKFIDETGAAELVGQCTPDRVVPEPGCNCTGDRTEPRFASQPVNGYADLHLHMFSNLAFGGLKVWGDAFNKWGGISQALRADPFAQRTADRVINGHVMKNNGEPVAPDLFAQSTIIHGTFHLGIPALIGIGTAEQPLTGMDNTGVEWNSTFAARSSDPDDFLGWPKWDTTTHQQAYTNGSSGPTRVDCSWSSCSA